LADKPPYRSCGANKNHSHAHRRADHDTATDDDGRVVSGLVDVVDGVASSICIEVPIAAIEERGILRSPLPNLGVVVSCSVADQVSGGVVDASGESKRLEARICIA